jgi:hypothetical protein
LTLPGPQLNTVFVRNSASTFDAALASETRPYSPQQLFDRFRKWLDAIRLEQ